MHTHTHTHPHQKNLPFHGLVGSNSAINSSALFPIVDMALDDSSVLTAVIGGSIAVPII